MAEDKQAIIDELRRHHSSDQQLMSMLDRAACALEGRPEPAIEKVPGPGGIADGLRAKKMGTIEAPAPVAFVTPTRPPDPKPIHRYAPPKKRK